MVVEAHLQSDHAELLSLAGRPSDFALALGGLSQPFLAGLDSIGEEFEQWRVFERSRREGQLAALVESVAAQALSLGDLATTRRLADCWGKLQPGDEAVARLGLAADGAAGETAAAQRRMTSLTAALAEELAAEPSAATRGAFAAAMASKGPAPPESLDPTFARPSPSISSPSSDRTSRSRTSPVVAALAAVVALAVLAAGGLWLVRSPAVSITAEQKRQAVELTATARDLSLTRSLAGYARAADLARSAIARDPEYAPAYVELAIALELPAWWADQDQPGARARIRAEAMGYLDRALALDPGSVRALAVKGLIIGGPEGRALLERAVKNNPPDADIWLWTANLRRQTFDYQGALAAYTRAMDVSPQSERKVSAYLTFARQLGRGDLADAALARFSPTAPGGVVRDLRAGEASQEGRLAEAARLDLEALQVGPPDGWKSVTRLAHLARAIGDSGTIKVLMATNPRLLHAYAPLYDPAGVVQRAEGQPVGLLSGIFAVSEARSLLKLGRHAQLLALGRYRGMGLADLRGEWRDSPVALGVQFVVALRRAGRAGDAEALRRDLEAWEETSARAGLAGALFLAERAQLACLSGDANLAATRLQAAIDHGWRGQFADVAVDLGDEPACETLSRAPGLAAARVRLTRLIGAERPAVARSLGQATAWLEKNALRTPRADVR